MTPDEERIELLELRGSSRITTADPLPGALRLLAGRDIDLNTGRTGARSSVRPSPIPR